MRTRKDHHGRTNRLGGRVAGASVLAVLAVLCLAGSAAGLTINLVDIGATPMTPQQYNAFRKAADIWQAKFLDPVTVNIEIAFEVLDNGILGSTRSARTTHMYTAVRAALVADAVSTAEKAAANSLPPGPSIQITDINGTRWDDKVTMSTANAKALGLGTGLDTTYSNPPSGIDATIKYNTTYAGSFDYNPDDGVPGTKYDIVGIATHEIAHALGFFSLTDMQDYNPAFTLHPNTMDLYRFAETGGAHSLGTGVRKVTHGAAEYYDSSLNNVPMSHGMMDCTDPHCHTFSGCCQSSHWDDDQGFLMDPSIAKGVIAKIETEDLRALDYIGWNRLFYINPYIIKWVLVAWFDDDIWPEIPSFEKQFERFPPPPPPQIVRFPGTANLALRAGFEFDGKEAGLRSGLGYARFEPSRRISPEIVKPLPPVREDEYLDPPGPPMSLLPQNLSELFIQSDLEGGIPFTFRSTCGDNGCPFDPGLGEYGGYRVPGILDGEGDQQAGDVDGHMTLVLLAPDPSGIPDPQEQNMFSTSPDMRDNSLLIFDPLAVRGMIPPVCGDADHPIPPADLDQNCIVNMGDLRIVAEQWLLCTAPSCP